MAETADSIDWRLTTWDGARREQLRRWAELPLDRVIAALEEMADLAEAFHPESQSPAARAAAVREDARRFRSYPSKDP